MTGRRMLNVENPVASNAKSSLFFDKNEKVNNVAKKQPIGSNQFR